MISPHQHISLWHAIRREDTRILPRLAASLIAALALVGMALGAAYAISLGHPLEQSGTFFYYPGVRDADVAIGLSGAGILWFAAQFIIWGPLQRGRRFVQAIIYTVGLWVVALILCIGTASVIRRGEECVIIGIILVALSATVWLWTTALLNHHAGRAIMTSEGLVDVRCPECGYSMIGLCQLRCPECGAAFTVDELIRAQYYGPVQPVVPAPPATAVRAEPIDVAGAAVSSS